MGVPGEGALSLYEGPNFLFLVGCSRSFKDLLAPVCS